jgi:hypothetical protein
VFGRNIVHTTRTSGKPQILGVGQRLVSLLAFKKSINSHCLMTLGDFLVGSVVTRLYVALCYDDSFVHQSEATECVSTYCLFLKGLDLVQIPIMLIFRCSISDNSRECDDIFVLPDNLNLIHFDHSKFIQ